MARKISPPLIIVYTFGYLHASEVVYVQRNPLTQPNVLTPVRADEVGVYEAIFDPVTGKQIAACLTNNHIGLNDE